MSTAVPSGRGTGPGRLDPTVRKLLRAFLSPAVADRYASALQPVATADRDAALAGAVTTLRVRFYVRAEELAVVLVEDAGWSVADVATMLGMPTLEVRATLRTVAAAGQPRIGAAPPDDVEHDEVAMVDAMLADLPRTRRRAGAVAEEEPAEEPVGVELRSTLPAQVGLPSLEARTRRADRIQTLVVYLSIAGVVGLLALTTLLTSVPGSTTDSDTVTADPETLPGQPEQTASPTRSPSASPTPGTPTTAPTAQPPVATGPVEVTGVRFVDSVDPATGDPGATIETAPATSNPRLWFRLRQLPTAEQLLEVAFTAPSGRTTLRPVLVTTGTPRVSLRLPDEFGRDPGRYAARVESEGDLLGTAEIELVTTEDG